VNTPSAALRSEIVASTSALIFAGPDAVKLYAVLALATALRLHARTGIVISRVTTPTRMKTSATAHTGKPYRRGRIGSMHAALDLGELAERLRASIPVTHQENAK